MKEQTLYDFGYLSSRSNRILKELIACKIPLVDVRYSPTSRRYEWTQEALEKHAGLIYIHVQELGNELYKDALSGQFTEPNIRIHAPEMGMTKLKAVLDEHGRAAICCACTHKGYHRFHVAKMAEEQFNVRVIHL